MTDQHTYVQIFLDKGFGEVQSWMTYFSRSQSLRGQTDIFHGFRSVTSGIRHRFEKRFGRILTGDFFLFYKVMEVKLSDVHNRVCWSQLGCGSVIFQCSKLVANLCVFIMVFNKSIQDY